MTTLLCSRPGGATYRRQVLQMPHDSSIQALSAGSPKVVLDLYDWLPPHGETTVSFRCEGLELIVEVAYDQESSGETPSGNLAIRFSGVCAFFVVVSPGVEMTRVNYDNMDVSGALVVYPNSEAARLWQGVLIKPSAAACTALPDLLRGGEQAA